MRILKLTISKSAIASLLGSLLLPALVFAGYSGSSPTWTTTPDYTSVAACIAAADPEDTINVSAGDGTETWNSQLTITRGINLIGPGADSLTITCGVSASGTAVAEDSNFLILWKPNSTGIAANDSFRLSGFKFDMDNSAMLIKLDNPTSTRMTNTRIDNNTVINSYTRIFCTEGNIYGVIDNNTITSPSFLVFTYYGNNDNWDNLTYDPGSQYNIFFEDNTITGATDTIYDGGLGATVVIRYNTHTASTNLSPWADLHGNQVGGNDAGMGIEMYGNLMTMTNNNNPYFDIRGGQSTIYYNSVVTSGTFSFRYREEYQDGDGTSFPWASDGQPQHISESYSFENNKNHTSLITPSITETVNYGGDTGLVPQLNRDVWIQPGTFNGTAGVGAGTLASRPATCTTGVAYWATNQSTANISDFVGADPTTTISGTLYICGSESDWSDATTYTPYTYPHPLRGDGSVVRMGVQEDSTGTTGCSTVGAGTTSISTE